MAKKTIEETKKDILDAYFHFRRPMPENGYVQQNRSTLEIQDDMAPMVYISINEIVEYMSDNEYAPTTEQDGTVRWAIWRMLGT